jgi:transcriptional regulator GlxA family with amidase domain
MHLAEDLLTSTDLGVATIARRVGYDAEEAFSGAFKRHSGAPPAHWQAQHPLRASGMADPSAGVAPW